MKHYKGILLRKLRDAFSGEREMSTTVARTYGADESNFVETVNEELKRKGIPVPAETKQRQKDLERFGTAIGLINVADDRPKSYFRPKSLTQLVEEESHDLEQYGTSTGIINVAQTDFQKKKRNLANRCLPSNRRFTENQASDLERFGTPEGLINVSTDETILKDRRICQSDIDPAAANLYAEINKSFSKAQVTIRNTSAVDKEITLWGANPEVFSGDVNYEAVEQQAVIGHISSAVHPQGMAYNPMNKMVYAANQLSGTITVANQQNQVVATIQLQPSFPGLCSPVAIAINTNPASVRYGYAYVACSVSNTIQVISPTHDITAIISAGCRPIAIAFNPINNLVYAANLVDNTLSVIDSDTHVLIPASPIAAGNGPLGIGVNQSTGRVYVCNSTSNTISVFDAGNALLTTINNAGQRPVSITYNPANGFMYAVATDSNEVLRINAVTHVIESSIPVGAKPYGSFYAPVNQYLYVQNRRDDTMTVIRPDNSVTAINVGEQNIGGIFNTDTNSIYITDTPNNRINVIGFGNANSGINISSDYAEMLSDFKSNFAIVQHVRFVVSGVERLYAFRLNRFNATGTVSTRRLSFENYASPLHGLNVSEFTALAGSMIDGRMNWKFMLPALHTVSVLIWYKQFKVQDLLPDKGNKPTNNYI